MKLNHRLTSLRKKKGLSQAELAETIKVSRQAVSRWEVGSALPTSENLKYLSQVYGVSLEYLISEDEEEKTEGTTIKDSCDAEEKIHLPKRIFHCIYYLVIALAVIVLGVGISYAVYKNNMESEPKKENVISIETMERDEGSEKIKEEGFSSK